MNWDQIEGQWKQLTGKAQERWGELTEDEVTQAKGDRQQLVGLIQEKYGKSKEQAEEEVSAWQNQL